jgi:hypothetical protein
VWCYKLSHLDTEGASLNSSRVNVKLFSLDHLVLSQGLQILFEHANAFLMLNSFNPQLQRLKMLELSRSWSETSEK